MLLALHQINVLADTVIKTQIDVQIKHKLHQIRHLHLLLLLQLLCHLLLIRQTILIQQILLILVIATILAIPTYAMEVHALLILNVGVNTARDIYAKINLFLFLTILIPQTVQILFLLLTILIPQMVQILFLIHKISLSKIILVILNTV